MTHNCLPYCQLKVTADKIIASLYFLAMNSPFPRILCQLEVLVSVGGSDVGASDTSAARR